METKTVSIPNINCMHCTRTIEIELSQLKGVTDVKAELNSKKVTISWDPPLEWNDIRQLLEDIGYPPEE
ncbi:MAG: heavy-metal-associated domain-containing protein [Acidobacteria bacterium]|nr:heavy-metal-associated domain-containing protein [Acidobacteriota bacterium]